MMKLSTVDQTPAQHYSIWRPAVSERSAGNLMFLDVSLQEVSAMRRRSEPGLGSHHQQKSLPWAIQIGRMREAREQLSRLRRNEEREARHREALRWLAQNRAAYTGRWVALRGSDLVAVGSSAKEVYEQVADAQPPALITRVEREDIPFGGW
jgi:hypothetical protein